MIFKSSFDICALAASCGSFSSYRTQWRCFTIKFIKFVNHWWIVVDGIYILFAKFRTHKNSHSLGAAWIAWSRTSEPLILGSPFYPQSISFPWNIIRQYNTPLHPDRELQQVSRRCPRLKTFACWERGKSSAGLFCIMFSSKVKSD
jgi:hypothetical protein